MRKSAIIVAASALLLSGCDLRPAVSSVRVEVKIVSAKGPDEVSAWADPASGVTVIERMDTRERRRIPGVWGRVGDTYIAEWTEEYTP